MSNKLLLVMIDGISADYFATSRGRLPHLSALAARGTLVENLHAEVLGTSLPGRTSIVTGQTAPINGIYANKLWDADERRFRHANPDDVRVPTLPAQVQKAGREAAVLGFGMIRPEDAAIFKPPWWIGEFFQRPRDAQPEPSDASWLRVFQHQDAGERFNGWCAEAGYPNGWFVPDDYDNPASRAFLGFICDTYALNWAGIVASADDAPDFIITEYLMTDEIQHRTGYKTDYAHWSIAQADAAVGQMLARMGDAVDEWHIAIMSDHGHSPIEYALQPQVIIPDATFQSDGSVLLVVPENAAQLASIRSALAEHDCEQLPVDFLPPEQRDMLAAFVAPPGYSFEHDNPDETNPIAPPRNVSSHGLRPGASGDHRFAIFAGPNVPSGEVIPSAEAAQIAPTCAALLGLPLDAYPLSPLYSPSSSA